VGPFCTPITKAERKATGINNFPLSPVQNIMLFRSSLIIEKALLVLYEVESRSSTLGILGEVSY
jgi:hypothetical protein